VNKEISSELSMFFGELKADMTNINKQLDNHSKKLDKQQEILEQMAKTEVLLSSIVEKQMNLKEDVEDYNSKVDKVNLNNQKKIEELEDKIEKNSNVISILKWAFSIITVIFTGVSIAAIKGLFGL
jgi:uncharacterized protein YlxW (UPF0749 family)